MADQRLAGLSHQELYAMAHGGQPGAASTSQASLAKAAQVLENVSRTLDEPLSQLGMGWQGRAAEAARGGIGQHAQWAQQAATQVGSIAEKAGAQFTSATKVIAEMPPPPSAPAAGANLAAAEDQAANLRQRALELMQGHAQECTQTRPTEVIARAPTAGTAAAAAGPEATRTGGRGGVRAAPAVEGGGPAGGIADGGGPGRTVSRAGLAESAGARADAGRSAASGAGTRPASAEPYRPGQGGTARGAAGVEPLGTVGARGERGGPARGPIPEGSWTVTPGAGAARGERSPRMRPVDPAAVSEPYASGPRGSRPGQRPGVPRGEREERDRRRTPRPLAPRGEVPHPLSSRGGPAPGGPGGPGTQGAAYDPGGAGTDPASARGPGHPGADATVMPPMVGGLGYPDSDPGQHERLDYLLDEHDMFDENGWVAPPVIGS
jgi:hypothetical protein